MVRTLLAIALSCLATLAAVVVALPHLSGSVQAPAAASATSQVDVAGDVVVDVRLLLSEAQLQPTLVAPVPYDRDDYSPGGWRDTDGDCQTDRHEILIEQSQTPVTLSSDGCRVESGHWSDPFDGQTYTRADEVTIDHLVALSAAHHAGAWQWDLESKQRFAHDLRFAGAFSVVGPEVNQSKAASGPHQWKPPQRAAWCPYATNWIRVKTRWELAFSVDEAAALFDMLDTCTTHTPNPVQPANPTVAAPTPVTSPTPIIVTTEAATVVIGDCDARAETVVLENRGALPAVLSGWRLHDRHQNHTLTLDHITIRPGARITIVSGDNPATSEGTLLWKPENIWNNSGDTATLIDSEGVEVSVYAC